MHTWNIYDLNEGWQLHGTLEIQTTDSPTTVKTNVCIQIRPGNGDNIEKRYDCITAIASDLDGQLWKLAFVDQYLFGNDNTIELDLNDKPVASESWQRDSKQAQANCTPGTKSNRVNC